MTLNRTIWGKEPMTISKTKGRERSALHGTSSWLMTLVAVACAGNVVACGRKTAPQDFVGTYKMIENAQVKELTIVPTGLVGQGTSAGGGPSVLIERDPVALARRGPLCDQEFLSRFFDPARPALTHGDGGET